MDNDFLFENYHRHSHLSNIFTPDSATTNEEYAQRAVELGHKTLCSMEHGFQGRYYETYELAKKYGLKFIFGVEAYWVKDRFVKDRTNAHIVLLAKSEKGRREINRVLSDANIDGYYYKPRVDIDLLLSMNPKEVMVTSACLAFFGYDNKKPVDTDEGENNKKDAKGKNSKKKSKDKDKDEDEDKNENVDEDVDVEVDTYIPKYQDESTEDIIVKLHNHFGENFFLEVQYHKTFTQKNLNRKVLELSSKHGIDIIMGCDSHYIYPEHAQGRLDVLEAKGVRYEEEDGWFLDYPSGKIACERFQEQGVLSDKQIHRAMNNTNKLLEFEDIEFNKDIKLPSIYPNKTQKEKNQIYKNIIMEQWKEFSKEIPLELHDMYKKEIKKEVQVIINTKMADYFLLDYKIIKEAVKMGGVITNTGRGSGCSFFTNTLLGFSKVDRISAPVKLYPERFISESRILETKSLPD